MLTTLSVPASIELEDACAAIASVCAGDDERMLALLHDIAITNRPPETHLAFFTALRKQVDFYIELCRQEYGDGE